MPGMQSSPLPERVTTISSLFPVLCSPTDSPGLSTTHPERMDTVSGGPPRSWVYFSSVDGSGIDREWPGVEDRDNG